MANELKAHIVVDAPGAEQTFNKVAAGAHKTEVALKKLGPTTNSATMAMTNMGRVVQDLPFGFLGIANNLNPLLESFQRLKAESGSTKTALKAMAGSLMGAGGLGLALSVASSLLIVFGDRIFGTGKKAKAAAEETKTFADTVKQIEQSVAKEAVEIGSLIAILKSETETRERKLAVLGELKKANSEIFGGLQLEGNLVNGVDAAYKTYIESLKTVIAVKIKQAQLEGIITKILRLEGVTAVASDKASIDLAASLKKQNEERRKKGEFILSDKKEAFQTEIQNNLYKDQAKLLDDISQLSKGLKVKIPTVTTPKLKIKPEAVEFDMSGRVDVLGIEELMKQVQIEMNQTNLKVPELAKSLQKMGAAAAAIFKDMQKPIKEVKFELTQMQELIAGTLSPAFESMFSSILAGENPLKAFFKSIGQMVQQLIAKLLAAAAVAAILSAIFPVAKGGLGFGNFFKGLIGLGGTANPGAAGGFMGGGRAININVTGQSITRGSDIIHIINRTSRSQRGLF